MEKSTVLKHLWFLKYLQGQNDQTGLCGAPKWVLNKNMQWLSEVYPIWVKCYIFLWCEESIIDYFKTFNTVREAPAPSWPRNKKWVKKICYLLQGLPQWTNSHEMFENFTQDALPHVTWVWNSTLGIVRPQHWPLFYHVIHSLYLSDVPATSS